MKKTILAAALSLAMIAPAFAIDWTQEIKTFDDKTFTDQTGKPSPQILGTVAENSLLQTQQGQPIEEKNKNFWLALKLHEHPKNPDLSAEDLATIKKAIGTWQPTAIYGQALRLIDPASVPKQ